MSNKLQVGLRSLVFLLCLLSSAILLTVVFTPLYGINAWVQDFPKIAGISMQHLLADYHRLIGYLLFPWQEAFPLKYFPSSTEGMQHFADVKRLIWVNTLVWLVATPLSVYFLRKIRQTATSWRYVRVFQWLMVVPVFFLVLMAIGFDRFFIQFHQLFFRNSDWLFDPSVDPIINVLPESFFLQCFLLFFLLLELFLYGAYRLARTKKRP